MVGWHRSAITTTSHDNRTHCTVLNYYTYKSQIQNRMGPILLAHLDSTYSLIWGSHKIWGKGGGEPLALYDK